jgi:enamine deaminase RidA (YjgF/YER057c/UK114 family)
MSITRLGKSARLSSAVVANGTVYLTGQVGKIDEDLTAQCRTALAAVEALLAAAGTDKSRVLEATVLLANMGDFEEMNVVWEEWVDADNPPARSTYEARLTKPGYRVEFIITASL